MNREKLIGKQFNNLTIISFTDNKLVSKVKYNCLCDCGNIKVVGHNNLVYNKTKTCGCYSKNKMRELCKKTFRLTPGESSSRNLYKCYEKKCRKLKREFNITLEYFRMITKMNCYYCEVEPGNRHKTISKDKEWEEINTYIYNGLDRIDSNLGYTEENVVPCCKICNTAKMDYPQDQFIEWLKRIANKFKDNK